MDFWIPGWGWGIWRMATLSLGKGHWLTALSLGQGKPDFTYSELRQWSY